MYTNFRSLCLIIKNFFTGQSVSNISDTYTRSYYYIISDFSPGKLLQKVSGQFLPNN